MNIQSQLYTTETKLSKEVFDYYTFYFDDDEWKIIACILVEFAEDIHNDIGIWNSYERYNLEFYGTRLPLTLEPDQDIEPGTINPYRIFHLLWVLYHEFDSDLIISPQHQDLWELSQSVTDFLISRFTKVPHVSGVKRFLAQTNKYGWDVKKKLVWLGRNSYLFRLVCNNYIMEQGGKSDIGVIDDFVCQETTCWSGLGVIDILTGIIDITQEQQNELRSWYERHNAYFKMLSINGPLIEVMNVLNDTSYTVRIGKDLVRHFKPGQIIQGSLIPWNNEWYWSGKQSFWDNLPEEEIENIKKEFIKIASGIVYRYNKELLKRARKELKIHYDKFVDYYGDDLKIYPDGLTMASDTQKFYRKYYESLSDDVISNHMKRYNLKNPWLKISYPPEILESDNGFGLFYNPEEGQEIMNEFNDVISGFKKKGVNLNEDEESSIRGFIYSEAISPQFVNKFVEMYGYESIFSSFLIRGNNDKTSLEYLLRRYKGHFYRNRYPDLGLI